MVHGSPRDMSLIKHDWLLEALVRTGKSLFYVYSSQISIDRELSLSA
jgi:hypothetical protein